MEEKKAIIRDMNEQEMHEFNKQMDFLKSEMKVLHRRSIKMAHDAHKGAAHAFLNC